MKGAFDLSVVDRIIHRLSRPPELIQIAVGPRQVGKTTAARTVGKRWDGPVRYAAADQPLPPGPEWIESHWQLARSEAGKKPILLILDEVQKVSGWSEVVKALWDSDRAQGRKIRVLLLGSSALLLARGIGESLAGRFFLHRFPHWSFQECQEAFEWELDRWLFFGGYPGAAPLVTDEEAWRSYVMDSLIETVLARDVLAMQTVAKPALLRQLFILAAAYPAQILSYNKMLGQLHDAGNTVTLAHYLRLLETAFLVSGLERYTGNRHRKRGSSPKLILWNNALVNALSLRRFADARQDLAWWGRLVENAVGAHLLNHLQGLPYRVTYWRDRDREVDYVIQTPRACWILEVKSGSSGRTSGLATFRRGNPDARPLLVGPGGVELEEFFRRDPREMLGE